MTEKDSERLSNSFYKNNEEILPPKNFLKWLKKSEGTNEDDKKAKNKLVHEFLTEKRFNHLMYLKQKREQIIELIGDFSIHGIPNFVRSTSHASRICWTIVSLISLGVSVYYIQQGILGFLAYDVTTKIRIINEQPTNFPSVTICNIHPFTTVYSVGFLKQSLIDGLMVLNGTDPLSNANLAYQTLGGAMYLARSTAVISSDSVKQKLGFTFDQFVLDCTFNKMKCNISDFDWYYDFNRGKLNN